MTTFLGGAVFLRGVFPLAGFLRGGDGVVDASRRMIRLPVMVLMPEGGVPSGLSAFLVRDKVLRGLSVMVSGCVVQGYPAYIRMQYPVLALSIYHGMTNLQGSGLPCGPGCSRFRWRCIPVGLRLTHP